MRSSSRAEDAGARALRVLVVDDHRLFSDALRPILETEGMEVSVVHAAAEAEQVARAFRPHVVLLDLRLGDERGIDVGRRLLAALGDGEMKVIAVTGRRDRAAVQEAVAAGFHGFLTKDTPFPALVSSIGAVLEGQLVIPQRTASGGGRTDEARRADELVATLTERQRDVLHLLVEGATTAEIARRLHISIGTVRTHVHAVLTKLHVRSRLEAAAFAVRFGYCRD